MYWQRQLASTNSSTSTEKAYRCI